MDSKLLNDFNEHIKIVIKNKEKKIVILISKFTDNNYAELTISNNKKNHLLNEKSIIIDDVLYNTYVSNICKIVFKWEDEYLGNEDINYQIKINIDKIIKNINGNGKFPPNWNEFIKLLADIENKYNIEIDKIRKKIDLFDQDILKATIDDLIYNPDFCTLYIPEENDKYSICETILGEQLNNFINYLDENNLFDTEYLSNYELIKKKKIEDLTYLELLTYLTFIIKREKIYPSSLYEDVNNGLLLNILNKIKDVIS